MIVRDNIARELRHLDGFSTEIPHLPHFDEILEEIRDDLDVGQLAAACRMMWDRAIAWCQAGQIDDRALYWARLKLIKALYGRIPAEGLWEVENHSRGIKSDEKLGRPHILLTGFDPFRLTRNPQQSNPSGMIALRLNGAEFNGLLVKTAVFPVRFAAFDNLVIERYLDENVDHLFTKMIITTSMGRNRFDLERFPSSRRTSSAADNAGVVSIRSRFKANGSPFDSEFVEFTLPVGGDRLGLVSGPWQIVDNREVRTTINQFAATSLDELKDEIAVEGSGGGFLSNEISYRAISHIRQTNLDIPIGHVHVPRVSGYDEQVTADIVSQFCSLLDALTRDVSRV